MLDGAAVPMLVCQAESQLRGACSAGGPEWSLPSGSRDWADSRLPEAFPLGPRSLHGAFTEPFTGEITEAGTRDLLQAGEGAGATASARPAPMRGMCGAAQGLVSTCVSSSPAPLPCRCLVVAWPPDFPPFSPGPQQSHSAGEGHRAWEPHCQGGLTQARPERRATEAHG